MPIGGDVRIVPLSPSVVVAVAAAVAAGVAALAVPQIPPLPTARFPPASLGGRGMGSGGDDIREYGVPVHFAMYSVAFCLVIS